MDVLQGYKSSKCFPKYLKFCLINSMEQFACDFTRKNNIFDFVFVNESHLADDITALTPFFEFGPKSHCHNYAKRPSRRGSFCQKITQLLCK